MSEERTNVNSNREVKSDVFTTLFSEPENAAQLYTALSGVETVSVKSPAFTSVSFSAIL